MEEYDNALAARQARVETLRRSAPFRPADLIVYLVLAALIGVLLWLVFAGRRALGSAAELEVYLDNRLVMTVSAAADGEYAVTRGGQTLLVLVVAEGRATVRDSVCEDHLCERMSIGATGQQIVCLPNGVSIQVRDAGMGGPVVPVG